MEKLADRFHLKFSLISYIHDSINDIWQKLRHKLISISRIASLIDCDKRFIIPVYHYRVHECSMSALRITISIVHKEDVPTIKKSSFKDLLK